MKPDFGVAVGCKGHFCAPSMHLDDLRQDLVHDVTHTASMSTAVALNHSLISVDCVMKMK